LRWHRRSTPSACFNTLRGCKKPSSSAQRAALHMFHTHLLLPFASFPFNVVQKGTFPSRGAFPVRQPSSIPCTESRKRENASWAGDVPGKAPLKESGSRSCPGWLPIPNGAVATSSGSCSASPPGRYHPLQIRTLQRGMRKIRAYLLETFEEQWQDEVIRGPCLQAVSSAENEALVT
jgi:hypothetical protein